MATAERNGHMLESELAARRGMVIIGFSSILCVKINVDAHLLMIHHFRCQSNSG
jgi:hypothetical protein